MVQLFIDSDAFNTEVASHVATNGTRCDSTLRLVAPAMRAASYGRLNKRAVLRLPFSRPATPPEPQAVAAAHNKLVGGVKALRIEYGVLCRGLVMNSQDLYAEAQLQEFESQWYLQDYLVHAQLQACESLHVHLRWTIGRHAMPAQLIRMALEAMPALISFELTEGGGWGTINQVISALGTCPSIQTLRFGDLHDMQNTPIAKLRTLMPALKRISFAPCSPVSKVEGTHVMLLAEAIELSTHGSCVAYPHELVDRAVQAAEPGAGVSVSILAPATLPDGVAGVAYKPLSDSLQANKHGISGMRLLNLPLMDMPAYVGGMHRLHRLELPGNDITLRQLATLVDGLGMLRELSVGSIARVVNGAPPPLVSETVTSLTFTRCSGISDRPLEHLLDAFPNLAELYFPRNQHLALYLDEAANWGPVLKQLDLLDACACFLMGEWTGESGFGEDALAQQGVLGGVRRAAIHVPGRAQAAILKAVPYVEALSLYSSTPSFADRNAAAAACVAHLPALKSLQVDALAIDADLASLGVALAAVLTAAGDHPLSEVVVKCRGQMLCDPQCTVMQVASRQLRVVWDKCML